MCNILKCEYCLHIDVKFKLNFQVNIQEFILFYFYDPPKRNTHPFGRQDRNERQLASYNTNYTARSTVTRNIQN